MVYLPGYYRKSRHIRAIMDAAGKELPDVDGELWKAFFVHLQSDASRELWRKELDAKDDEELLAKLRSNGTMSVETLKTQGFGLQESYRLMPEAGVELSESGVLADGWEFSPLSSVIYTTPETLAIARGLVALMGLAGFRYLFSVSLSHHVEYQRGTSRAGMNLYTAVTMPDRTDDDLSGNEKQSSHHVEQYALHTAGCDRKSWWSPNITFLEQATYLTQTLRIQKSNVSITT